MMSLGSGVRVMHYLVGSHKAASGIGETEYRLCCCALTATGFKYFHSTILHSTAVEAIMTVSAA
jgi:hypothetical protein